MIKSYFFIPGDHPTLIEKLNEIKSDNLIIDLEDSLHVEKIDTVLQILYNVEIKQNFWVRPRLFVNNKFNENILKELISIGFKNFIIPKIKNLNQLRIIENSIDLKIKNKINLIILIENPECLMNLQNILNDSLLNIIAIGFGSQDYCNTSGMNHTTDILKYPRFIISNTAKAFGIECIDIACMDIHNNEAFHKEINDAIVMGYDGKFVIHPKQLEVLNDYDYFSNNEILESQKIIEEYEKLGKPSIFVYNGKAIEPPHIIKYQSIINGKRTENEIS